MAVGAASKAVGLLIWQGIDTSLFRMQNFDMAHLVYMARRLRHRKLAKNKYGLPPKLIFNSSFHLLETPEAKKVAKLLTGVKGRYSRKTKMLADAVMILAHGVEE